ncbi:MAG TPA: APC family permease [Blastocatellia bacterium]|nr:APC family permease [Blastocatellia bacterium]
MDTTENAAVAAAAAADEKHKLKAAMGLSDLVLFYIAAVVGLRWVANASKVGPSAVSVWIMAFILFFIPLSMAVIELSSRYPEEGGLYIWSKQAFGDFHGFMTGWTYWWAQIVYLPTLLFYAASNSAYVVPRLSYLSESKTYVAVFSIIGLSIALCLNIVGLNVGKWLHNASGSFGTWLPAMILIAMGIIAWIKFGPSTHFAISTMKPKVSGIYDIVFWSNIAFAFGGIEGASVMSEEVKDARRVLPRALLGSGAIITFLYIAGTVSLLMALPVSQTSALTGITDAVQFSAQRVGGASLGQAMGSLISLLQVVGYVGGVGVWMATTSRLPFVAGIDRYLPRVFGKIHPKWGTPYVALMTQAGLTVIFIVLSKVAGKTAEQAYLILVNLAIIAYFIPFLYMFASLVKLQSKPTGEGTMRVPGGKAGAYIAGIVGFTVTAVAIFLACWPSSDAKPDERALFFESVFGTIAVTLALGVAVYWIGSAKKKRL